MVWVITSGMTYQLEKKVLSRTIITTIGTKKGLEICHGCFQCHWSRGTAHHPIQMANFTAAIANRGYFIQPHFLKSVSNDSLNKVYEKRETSIDSIHFETVIDGMYQVVERGTAKVAKNQGS